MDFDVIVLGDYCLDLIFTGLKSFPQLGAEVEAKAIAIETGGACNTALALHRLGVKTGWAVEFGTDEFSEFVLKRLRDDHFPENLFVFSKKMVRKITVSLSFPEDRAFIAYYDQGKMVETAFKGMLSKKAKVVVIPALVYGPSIIFSTLMAKMKDMLIFMDGNSSEAVSMENKAVKKSIESVRFFSPNAKEARQITQEEDLELAVRILGKLCQTVIIKDGSNGCWCSDNQKIYYQPAYKVKVIDTTGAGDCFNAGFLKAWLEGKDIQTCLKWGNLTGALSTQKPGANGYRLSAREINEILLKEK